MLLLLTCCCAATGHGERERAPAVTSELDLVVQDLCERKVVLLGEDNHHGSGTTFAFKTRLVKRLVDECHFDGFLIEAGTYDFIDLEARRLDGTPIDHTALAAAFGGLWAHQEMAELIAFLAARAERAALVVGGIDDQINRGTYAHRQMSGELTAFLGEERRGSCQATLDRYTRWTYDAAHPYTADAVKAILGCWQDVAAALASPAGRRSGRRLDGYLHMVAALERAFHRDLARAARGPGEPNATQRAQDFNARDRSMFASFEWWMTSHPRVKKVIVWTATVHAAKRSLDPDFVPFGAHVFGKYGSGAFVLGFSAQAGRIFTPDRGAVDLEPAGTDTLERRAVTPGSRATRYLEREQLAAFGAIGARAIDYERWMVASWNTVLDGLVVFHEEVAATPLLPWKYQGGRTAQPGANAAQ